MELEKKLYLEELFDLYTNLLTDYQREIFSLYYQEDLSLFEIAEIKNVSRNAVFSLIHRVEKILEDYETKLGLYAKNKKIIEILNKEKVETKVIEKVEKIMEK